MKTLALWQPSRFMHYVLTTQVALATEIPDYNQMTLPLGGGHTATAAQMRHFCRSYEFQLPPQPSSMSPPLQPPSTVQFSTLGPGGRHVYCNIPMTLLNGQVGTCIFQVFLVPTKCRNIHHLHRVSFSYDPYCYECMCSELKQNKNKSPLFSPGVQSSSLGNKRSVWIKEKTKRKIVSFYIA